MRASAAEVFLQRMQILLINSVFGICLWLILAGLVHHVMLYSSRSHVKHLLVRGAFGAAVSERKLACPHLSKHIFQ